VVRQSDRESDVPEQVNATMTVARRIGVVGAVLFVAFLAAHPPIDAASVRRAPYAVIHALGAAAMTMIAVGMLGVTGSIWGRVNRLGRLAYLMAFVGTVLWVGMLFFDGFVNPVLAVYAPAMVHPGLERMIELYGPALSLVGLCLVAFGAGYVGLAIATARDGIVATPVAVLLASGAVVFDVGLVAHGLDPLTVERIGGPLFAAGFVLLMRSHSGRGGARPGSTSNGR
jgi:hypothetical protein